MADKDFEDALKSVRAVDFLQPANFSLVMLVTPDDQGGVQEGALPAPDQGSGTGGGTGGSGDTGNPDPGTDYLAYYRLAKG